VPLCADYLVRDFAAELALPILIVAHPGLGTINHTLMTVECARSAGLEVAAVVLTPWRRFPRALQRSNRSTIEALADVETFGLPKLEIGHGVGTVQTLPVERWVGEPAKSQVGA
jgi:dethiobiotin synthetase